MISKELVDYIKEQRSKGYHSDVLYRHLIRYGYTPSEARQAIAYADREKKLKIERRIIEKRLNKRNIKREKGMLDKKIIHPSEIKKRAAPGTPDGLKKEQEKKPKEKKKFKRKILFGAGILIILCSILIFAFFSGIFQRVSCNNDLDCEDDNPETATLCLNPGSKTSECIIAPRIQLSDSMHEIELGTKEAFSFDINSQGHILRVERLTGDSAIFALYSDPILFEVFIGDHKEIDINGDGINDLYLGLLDIIDGKPFFEIRLLKHESLSYYECMNDNDCYQECIGCVTGSQLCDLSSQRCIECFSNYDCVSGYECIDSQCIQYENIGMYDLNDETPNGIFTDDGLFDDFDHESENDIYDIRDENNLYHVSDEECETEMVDCGSFFLSEYSVEDPENMEKFECFIDSARECCPASISVDLEMDLGFVGLIANSKTYREIRGIEDQRCVYYQRYDDVNYEFSDEMRQMLLDEGLNEEEIDEQIKQINEEGREALINTYTLCRYPIEDLVQTLENEKQGHFSWSTEDFNKYECTGTNYGV